MMVAKPRPETHLGSYALQRDTLRICVGKDRPKTFTTQAGSKRELFTYQRQNPR